MLKKAASGVLAILPYSRTPCTLRASKWLRPCWTDFFEHSLQLMMAVSSWACICHGNEIFNSLIKRVQSSLTNFLLAEVHLKFIEFIETDNIHLPLDDTSQNMTNICRRIQRVILIGILLLLFALFSACNHHPQGRHSTKAQPPLVEQQLLSTVKNAETLGQGNPLLLSSIYSLANFYQDRKEYDKAAAQYERALHIKEEMSGPDHPDIAAILQRYARLLQEANRPTEAANHLARANAILARSSPPPVSQ